MTLHHDHPNSYAHGKHDGLWLIKINSTYHRQEDGVASAMKTSFVAGLLELIDPKLNQLHKAEGYTARNMAMEEASLRRGLLF
ncbi:hypothetical protein TrVE_jg2842 [Triparma verrucosa]|uniref:Uncharacterized protein n=1 Tax=Triparma verrucosa TaxID=1606542 RepID=A0A9W7BBA7_9STRA|nr:hypothetical protein TrVE_jg2842 [Triparma verrucosa]